MRPTRRWRGACSTPYEPEVLILVAGANPVMRPLQYQTWETFSVNWHTDVKIAFTWLREALLSRCRLAAGWWNTPRRSRAVPGWTLPLRR